MSSFVSIGSTVPEKMIFKGILLYMYMCMATILDNVTLFIYKYGELVPRVLECSFFLIAPFPDHCLLVSLYTFSSK